MSDLTFATTAPAHWPAGKTPDQITVRCLHRIGPDRSEGDNGECNERFTLAQEADLLAHANGHGYERWNAVDTWI